jgi:hypothetical protein
MFVRLPSTGVWYNLDLIKCVAPLNHGDDSMLNVYFTGADTAAMVGGKDAEALIQAMGATSKTTVRVSGVSYADE